MREVLRTFTGRRIHFLKPELSEISIIDIAHALSQIQRFSGQLAKPYFVAEHSIHVSDMILREPRMGAQRVELAMAGLLHDAAESYLSDVPAPVKDFLPDYVQIELGILQKVFEKFGLAWEFHALVKPFDERALKTELQDIVKDVTVDLIKTRPDDLQLRPLKSSIAAEVNFLRQFLKLEEMRNEKVAHLVSPCSAAAPVESGKQS